jgi:hypothetical protein
MVDEIVTRSAKGAEYWKDTYYKFFDTSRHALNAFYRDRSTLLWNGQPVSGVAAICEFLLSLPPCRHNITTLDSQAIPTAGERERRTGETEAAWEGEKVSSLLTANTLSPDLSY